MLKEAGLHIPSLRMKGTVPANYVLNSVVRKHALARGGRSVWEPCRREALAALSVDQGKCVDVLQRYWAVVDISLVVCNRPDWPVLASMRV